MMKAKPSTNGEPIMVLTDKSRELILILQKNPLASFVEIASQIHTTSPTAKRRLEALLGKHGDERIINGFSARINQPRLGLENHSYLISLQGNDTIRAYRILEQLAEYHPYTSYHNHIFGGTNGIMIQFNTPKGTESLLQELLEFAGKQVQIDGITHLAPPEIQFESYPEIEFWKNGIWDFNFRQWLKIREEGAFKQQQHQEDTISLLDNLSLTDIILIRELMINARRKQVNIINDINHDNAMYDDHERSLFDKNNQRNISRRLEFIEQNSIIREYRLLYNRETFGLFNQMVFYGKMTEDNKSQLLDALSSANNPLPFRSSLRFVGESYFWWFNLPPAQSAEVMNVIFELSEEMQIGILDTSSDNQRSYPIFHRNFDARRRKWITNRKIMIEPLKSHIFD